MQVIGTVVRIMSLFGVLFVLTGFVHFFSLLLPANDRKPKQQRAIIAFVGVYFVFVGVAKIADIEYHPLTVGVAMALVVVVLALAGYDKLFDGSA